MSDEISSIQFKHGERVQVLTTQPIDRLLDYIVPETGVSLGSFVMVPLGPRQVLGVVWGPVTGGADGYKLREISRLLDVPAMTEDMRSFLARTAEYTVTPLSAMLRLATRVPGLEDAQKMQVVYQRGSGVVDRMTPARQSVLDVCAQYPDRYYMLGELAKLAQVSNSVVKGLVSLGAIKAIEAPKDQPFAPLDAGFAPVDLTQGQAQVATQLRQKIEAKSYSTTLLQGITGSGKTEVYFEAIAAAIEQGRQVLVMIPEIALTVEFMDRFAARFGARPAEWHSAITQSERRRTWHMVARNKAQVVVGARSALFLPFANLGLIVVDEEHDPSSCGSGPG